VSAVVSELDFSRINVVGVSGSGKSTFSRRLAALLERPYIEMDSVYWEPEWTEPSDVVFFERLRAELVRERWVLDGNYSRTIPIKWARATLVIWLDYPLRLATYRVIKRSIQRVWSQHEFWPGTNNRESIGRLLSRRSIVLWTLQSHARVRRNYEARIRERAGSAPSFVRLTSPRAAQQFLDAVARLQRGRETARANERTL
jgi:adenylate kinase family enzyme